MIYYFLLFAKLGLRISSYKMQVLSIGFDLNPI